MSYTFDTTKYIDKALSTCKKMGVNIDLKNPKTIQDKLMWLNIYDTDRRKCECADKIKIHDYCKKVLGEDICVPLIKVYKKTEEIKFDELPDKFALKCNHGSGMNIIVNNKKTLNKEEALEKLNRWLKTDFAFRNGFEAHYHDIERKVFAEQYMNDGHETLFDYKFWCFNGEPKFYTINDGYGHSNWMTFYDMNQNKLPISRKDYIGKPTQEIKQPSQFGVMKEYAKKLSEPFKFVRVDFYEINGKVYLGELTFTPGALYFRYSNSDDEINVGKMLKL